MEGDTPTTKTPVASFTVAKSASVADTNGDTIIGDAGDVITYGFAVTNTGTVALTNVVVSDPMLPTLKCVIASLPVGATNVACAASNNTYTVTAADVLAGKVTNIATATGTPPGSITPPNTTTPPVTTPTKGTPVADIALVKTATVNDTNADAALGDAGDVITYVFKVTNTGTVDLTDVTVSDPLLHGLSCVIAHLAVGASDTCAASGNTYVITAADETAEHVVNTASATAVPPGTIPRPSTTATVTTPTSKTPAGVLHLTKQAGQPTAKIGDLVRYTIQVDNLGLTPASNATLVDTLPVGFSYVSGSLKVADADNAGTVGGISPLRINGLDIAVGGHATVIYYVRVGAGTGKGVHTNRVVATDPGGRTISNQASADVELAGDPLFDDSLIVGTVFDDRNGDGWQASASASKVHVQGGFAPNVYIPGSTSLDRGKGPQVLADHSAPMLHGVTLGSIAGLQSSSGSPAQHELVIRQWLTAADFSNDFVLTTAEGTTLRMDADGHTTVERTGDVAKGLNAQELTVERKLSQTGKGLQVDYIIRNRGVDERGIPGVRLASVEGLVMETDAYGRFHVEGIDGGAWARGRNFILKVDPSTLPTGSVFSTENPRVRRITPGVPVRFDFGVKLPPDDIKGGRSETDINLGEVLFAPDSAEVRVQYQPMLDSVSAKVRQYDGGVLIITAQAGREVLALARANAVKAALQSRLSADLLERTRIEVKAAADDSTLVSVAPSIELGSVLFDTDKATIKPAYVALIRGISKTLSAQGGGLVAVIGRADQRGSNAYNVQLGLRRAKAVYAAIAAGLPDAIKQKIRVELSDDPDAPSGLGGR